MKSLDLGLGWSLLPGNVGQADRPDVLEIEIESRQAELALLQTRSRLDRARRQLGILVGDESAVVGRLEGALEDTLPRVDVAVLSEILEQSPQVAVARLGVERARAMMANGASRRDVIDAVAQLRVQVTRYKHMAPARVYELGSRIMG